MVVEEMCHVHHCTWQEEPNVEAEEAMWNTTNTVFIFLLNIPVLKIVL